MVRPASDVVKILLCEPYVTEGSAARPYLRDMDIALIIAIAGIAMLAIARLLGRGTDPIGRHAYNRIYSDAPGAFTDR